MAAPLTKGPKKAFLRRVYLSVFYSTTIVLIEPKYSQVNYNLSPCGLEISQFSPQSSICYIYTLIVWTKVKLLGFHTNLTFFVRYGICEQFYETSLIKTPSHRSKNIIFSGFFSRKSEKTFSKKEDEMN